MNLLILGAGGHGRVVKEVAEAIGNYNRIAFLDDLYDGSNLNILNSNVIGKLSDCEKFTTNFTHAFVAIGNPQIRKQWMGNLIACGYQIPILIHPDAHISPSVSMDTGSVVMPKAALHSNVRIGKGCIISLGAVIDHDAIVGDYCHVNAGAIVVARSRLESFTKVDYGEVYQ